MSGRNTDLKSSHDENLWIYEDHMVVKIMLQLFYMLPRPESTLSKSIETRVVECLSYYFLIFLP